MKNNPRHAPLLTDFVVRRILASQLSVSCSLQFPFANSVVGLLS